MIKYKDGTKNNPVKTEDVFQAFDVARERNIPTWCQPETDEKPLKYYPSKYYPSGFVSE